MQDLETYSSPRSSPYGAGVRILDRVAASRRAVSLLVVVTVAIAVLIAAACLIAGPEPVRVTGVVVALALVASLGYVVVATRGMRHRRD